MAISSLVLTEFNLVNGPADFDPSTTPKPYNRLYVDLPANLAGKKIALQKINMYYSWPNITNTNNKFDIGWPMAGPTDVFSVSITIPVYTNFASISEINTFLQTVCIQNKFYLIDNNGDNVYYMEFVENANSYGVSLVQYLIPTTLPVGWSQPAGAPALPTISRTMAFYTDAISDFNKLIGFAKNLTLNGNTTATTFNSSFTPQLSPTSTILVKCSHANNPLSLNYDSSIIYSFTSKGTQYGSIIEVEPQNIVYYNITSNSNTLVLEFTDQSNNPLYIQDPNMSVLLLFSDESFGDGV